MINGIIKLFYSEIVKAKIKNLPSDEYKLVDECKDIQNIACKIDNIFFKVVKYIIGIALVVLAFNIKIILGVEVLLLSAAYAFYKRNLEIQFKESLENIKNNIEVTSTNLFNEKSKVGLNLMVSLIFIGILAGFSYPLVISFLVAFLFTIKHICSNIK